MFARQKKTSGGYRESKRIRKRKKRAVISKCVPKKKNADVEISNRSIFLIGITCVPEETVLFFTHNLSPRRRHPSRNIRSC